MQTIFIHLKIELNLDCCSRHEILAQLSYLSSKMYGIFITTIQAFFMCVTSLSKMETKIIFKKENAPLVFVTLDNTYSRTDTHIYSDPYLTP